MRRPVAHRATRQPNSASNDAAANPMPAGLPAPVTSATCPDSENSGCSNTGQFLKHAVHGCEQAFDVGIGGIGTDEHHVVERRYQHAAVIKRARWSVRIKHHSASNEAIKAYGAKREVIIIRTNGRNQ